VLPAADCAIIKPIAAGALATLAPMQTAAATAAASALGDYLTQLNTALSHLTSTRAKSDLGAFITALSHASSTSTASQTAITAALDKLGADCP
jgi:flagellin-like hook-associated protein FlgL